MPSKSSIAVSAAAVALAMTSSVLAAPISTTTQPCQSLGKGPLGFNSSNIQLYSTYAPAVYFSSQDNILVASDLTPYNESLFEFFQCTYYGPDQVEKGDTQTWQGYIKAPDGNCVTVDALEQDGEQVLVKTEPCSYNSQSSLGDVKANQHFQIQLNTFYYFYTAVFLGDTSGPVSADFGGGGNYHFNVDDGDLYVKYNASQPQTGKKSEQLIGQLEDQFNAKEQMSPCTLVKSGGLELVDTVSGETSKVGTSSSYGSFLQVNSSSTTTFDFYQCDSVFMGYHADSTNHYGHLRLAQSNDDNACYVHGPYSVNIFELGSANNQVVGACGLTDDYVQRSSFFHLAEESGEYTLTYLNTTVQEPSTYNGWTVDQRNQDLGVNQTESSYKLRFIN